MSDTKCATYGREAYLLPNWARDPSKRCTTMMRTGRCTATMMQLQQVVQGNVALNVARVIAQWSDIYPIHRVALPIHRAGSSDRLLREHNPSIDRIILCNTLQFHTNFYLQHWCTIALSQLFKLPMMIRGVARRKMVTHLIFLNGFSIDHSWPCLSDDDYWWWW